MEHRSVRGSERTSPEQFAAWLRKQLERRGYDLRPRGGGQTRFIKDSGLSAGTVSRMLSGQTTTETRTLQQLADALDLPLGEVLVAAGILSAGELENVRSPQPRHTPMTPEQAADELGIVDPHKRELFINMTETLQRQRATNGGTHTAEN
ncbi:XRE family transcriptional regulator [Streptomyces albofaciens JCM 4342]|nr:XRE family transcriptional regulator [Streptomyces albofaciens JCM 4342]KAA6220618.1 XRE family transcriptional regulator [Streptomyces albofaciens JCM 4342]